MNKVIDNRHKWILTGYDLFGEIGPEALNVEKLSNLVGLNRSSFYHYFGDMMKFEGALFEHHKERYESIATVIKDYERFDQLFSEEVFDHKNALAFQRQLLVNQATDRYRKCSDEARIHTEKKTFELWTAMGKNEKASEEDWMMFRAMRDFYFVHHGQPNGLSNPKDMMLLLHKYLNKGS
jgi:AcrR family transcriptional regulator